MKEQSGFGLMMDASLLFKAFVMFSNQGTNLISLGALQGEGFCFSSKVDLMEVFKEAHVMSQAERAGNMYMLRNLEVTVGEL